MYCYVFGSVIDFWQYMTWKGWKSKHLTLFLSLSAYILAPPPKMSSTPVQEPLGQDVFSGSSQTLPSRPIHPATDPSASKRVCFYKSGDYTFSGHRLVINARTFKTFDALLDALSKKVPLPFGVRTITTPRGTHLVRALGDLHDGGSYVCSDQKRVKPLNLNEVNRRQVPWNTTRPYSAGRRLRLQLGKRIEAPVRPVRVTERVAVKTPKKFEVISNRDPAIKRTIVLQRRTAPTFDALLDYLSQILQFPVLKLFSTDGRRVSIWHIKNGGTHNQAFFLLLQCRKFLRKYFWRKGKKMRIKWYPSKPCILEDPKWDLTM